MSRAALSSPHDSYAMRMPGSSCPFSVRNALNDAKRRSPAGSPSRQAPVTGGRARSRRASCLGHACRGHGVLRGALPVHASILACPARSAPHVTSPRPSRPRPSPPVPRAWREESAGDSDGWSTLSSFGDVPSAMVGRRERVHNTGAGMSCPPIVDSRGAGICGALEDVRMRPRTRLPRRLGERFTVGDAETAGVGRSRRNAPDLARPFHGVRAKDRPRTFADLVDCYRPRMKPGHRYGGRTGMRLWGIPHPKRWKSDEPLEVMVPPDTAPPTTAGVKGAPPRRRSR